MALTPDQRAVIELLLAGQSYPELADLLELEQPEVERRAREALAELGGADPDRNVGLSDYLLGQADPIGRADAVRHLRQDAADHALAVTLLARLAEIAPAADLPRLPPPPGGRRFMGAGTPSEAAEPKESRSPLDRIPQRRSRVYAGLAAAAVILVAAVLALAGVFAGDEDSSDGTPAAEENGAAEGIGEIPDGEEITRVPLTPTGGGDAAGAAIVGLATGDQVYLDLLVENLDPAPQGQAYVVWFMFGGETGYPLSPITPDRQGSFQDRFAIPTPVTGLIPNTRSIEIALSGDRQTLQAIQSAIEEETFEITRPGRTVLSGRIPREEPTAEGQRER